MNRAIVLCSFIAFTIARAPGAHASSDPVSNDVKDFGSALTGLYEEQNRFFQAMNEHMKKMDEEMNKFFESGSFGFEKKSDKATNKKFVEITQEGNSVVIKMHLENVDEKGISIEPIGDEGKELKPINRLNGTVQLKDGKVTFYIQDGLFFGLNIEREVKKEIKAQKDGERTTSNRYSSFSEHFATLPCRVTNLDKTEINYLSKEGVLEIKLPATQKRSTKPLYVHVK